MWTLTEEKRKLLAPQDAIDLLKEGNKRFVNNLKINRDLLQQVNETSAGQYPFATILSCIDSRTSAELIFDQGLGDIFSIRIAGNILNDDILASMEFACKIAGSKLIMVLGHTRCGAIQGACKGATLGHLTSLLEKLTPAIQLVKNSCPHLTSNDADFETKIAQAHVSIVMDQIIAQSTVIKTLCEENKVGLIGGLYCVESGKVLFNE